MSKIVIFLTKMLWGLIGYTQELEFAICRDMATEMQSEEQTEKNMKSIGIHKNGRPTKTDQLEIEHVLRPYFERKISAWLTSQKTGINIKTICTYFKKWKTEIMEFEKIERNKTYKEEKNLISMYLEGLKLELHEIFDTSKGQIKELKEKGKPIPKHITSTQLATIKSLTEMTKRIDDVKYQPDKKVGPKEIEMDEKQVRDIVVHLIKPTHEKQNHIFTSDEILHETILKLKCDLESANSIFKNMVRLGLDLCISGKRDPFFQEPTKFDIAKFAKMRGYE